MGKNILTLPLAQTNSNLQEFNGWNSNNLRLYNTLTTEEKKLMDNMLEVEMNTIPSKRRKFADLFVIVKDINSKKTKYKYNLSLYESLTPDEKEKLDKLMLDEIDNHLPVARQSFMKLYFQIKFR